MLSISGGGKKRRGRRGRAGKGGRFIGADVEVSNASSARMCEESASGE